MKTAINTLLASVGLAPAGYVGQLAAQSRQPAEWATELEARFAKHRTDVEGWKDRHRGI